MWHPRALAAQCLPARAKKACQSLSAWVTSVVLVQVRAPVRARVWLYGCAWALARVRARLGGVGVCGGGGVTSQINSNVQQALAFWIIAIILIVAEGPGAGNVLISFAIAQARRLCARAAACAGSHTVSVAAGSVVGRVVRDDVRAARRAREFGGERVSRARRGAAFLIKWPIMRAKANLRVAPLVRARPRALCFYIRRGVAARAR